MEYFGGVYLLALDLPPGSYRYKLIVDGFWIYDEANPLKEQDPFGGYHSLLIVEEDQPALSWEEVSATALRKQAGDFVKLYRSGEEQAELRFSWFKGLADTIILQAEGKTIPLCRIGSSAMYDVYSMFISFTAEEPTFSPFYLPGKADFSKPSQEKMLNFTLEVAYQGKFLHLGAEGFAYDSSALNPVTLKLADYQIFAVPSWVGSGVIYQIFPDRFYNGDKTNDPDFSEWYYADSRTPPASGEFLKPGQEYFHLVQDWNDISGLSQSPYLAEGWPDWWSFYGGDIAGVLAKLDYLSDLGIDIIYFNPLWQAKSNHKYDSADYHSIDPHFGTTEQMIQFVAAARARGIRIILDVAFNHTGEAFWAFRDTVENGHESPYWNWYDWTKWPLPRPLPIDFKPREYYQCWWGIKDMPDLNYDLSRHHPEENAIRNISAARVNAPLVEYLMQTVRWWLLDIGIDGFRLDVPDEVPYWFWELFRKEVKKCKPEAWIVGEIWYDAQDWVNHKYFDSVMNYAYFKNPVIEYFIFDLIGKDEFVQRIESGLAMYPFHALKAMMNLLGSHDTLRIFELAKGDIMRIKLAVLFSMCFIGAPHVYYGDEIALAGGKDPDNRRPFNWDWENNQQATELRAFYRELISLRHAHAAFTDGSFSFLPSPNGLLSFSRTLADESLQVIINPTANAQTIIKPGLEQILFSSCELDGNLLPAQSAIIFTH